MLHRSCPDLLYNRPRFARSNQYRAIYAYECADDHQLTGIIQYTQYALLIATNFINSCVQNTYPALFHVITAGSTNSVIEDSWLFTMFSIKIRRKRTRTPSNSGRLLELLKDLIVIRYDPNAILDLIVGRQVLRKTMREVI